MERSDSVSRNPRSGPTYTFAPNAANTGRSSTMSETVIVSGCRTAIGKFGGAFAEFSGSQLGGFAIKGALERANLSPDEVDYVIMGQVLQAGTGQITARQAANGAGIPMSIPALTVNKV